MSAAVLASAIFIVHRSSFIVSRESLIVSQNIPQAQHTRLPFAIR